MSARGPRWGSGPGAIHPVNPFPVHCCNRGVIGAAGAGVGIGGAWSVGRGASLCRVSGWRPVSGHRARPPAHRPAARSGPRHARTHGRRRSETRGHRHAPAHTDGHRHTRRSHGRAPAHPALTVGRARWAQRPLAAHTVGWAHRHRHTGRTRSDGRTGTGRPDARPGDPRRPCASRSSFFDSRARPPARPIPP